jgi:hypothetical protein
MKDGNTFGGVAVRTQSTPVCFTNQGAFDGCQRLKVRKEKRRKPPI